MNIYIVCPAYRVTGGVELAHQLCYAINSLTKYKAYMWYTDIKNPSVETLVVNTPAPIEYAEYKTECATDFFEIDEKDNVVVFPETLTYWITIPDNARKVLWWMSVDNYKKITKENDINEIAENVCLHLYQSYYSKDYVEGKIPGAEGLFLSDYINSRYLNDTVEDTMRENTALYNPLKGYENLISLKEKADWLKWVELKGFNRDEMVSVMQSAKIYVDFGKHPGKDRIPREAAANGCCIITNREGAANYHEDVPIPDRYKFKEPAGSLDEMDALLHDICDDFSAHQADFEPYREMIRSEKELFNKAVVRFVEMMEQ